jgi:hypothetical protein
MTDADLATASGGAMRDHVPPVSGLFGTPDEHLQWDNALTEALHEARQSVSGGRVAPAVTADVFRGRLADFDFN